MSLPPGNASSRKRTRPKPAPHIPRRPQKSRPRIKNLTISSASSANRQVKPPRRVPRQRLMGQGIPLIDRQPPLGGGGGKRGFCMGGGLDMRLYQLHRSGSATKIEAEYSPPELIKLQSPELNESLVKRGGRPAPRSHQGQTPRKYGAKINRTQPRAAAHSDRRRRGIPYEDSSSTKAASSP